jgi:hypothetical protein
MRAPVAAVCRSALHEELGILLKHCTFRFGATLLVVALATSACSAPGDSSPAAADPPSSAAASTSATPSETSPSARTSTPASRSSAPASSTTVATEKAGSTLSLADFFEPDSSWTENRYDVADKSGVSGIAAPIDSYRLQTLELRLANNFSNLTFNVGQANDSKSSDKMLVVRVVGNGKQLDVRKVPFNVIQEISVATEMVNAVKIEVSLENTDSRDSKTVSAVISDVTLD